MSAGAAFAIRELWRGQTRIAIGMIRGVWSEIKKDTKAWETL